ncbi:MAG TPA: hypothetical protein VNP03_02190 [Pseudonocardia sp.]|nr:hypothetical protein [Pseudonocardia sp.]
MVLPAVLLAAGLVGSAAADTAPAPAATGAAMPDLPAMAGQRPTQPQDGGPVFGALAATAAGFDTAYPDLELSDLFNAKGQS